MKGVAEVASIGGAVKQYQISLDPQKLLALKVPLHDVTSAGQRSNEDVGGVIEVARHEHVIRGRGYVHTNVAVSDGPRITPPANISSR